MDSHTLKVSKYLELNFIQREDDCVHLLINGRDGGVLKKEEFEHIIKVIGMVAGIRVVMEESVPNGPCAGPIEPVVEMSDKM